MSSGAVLMYVVFVLTLGVIFYYYILILYIILLYIHILVILLLSYTILLLFLTISPPLLSFFPIPPVPLLPILCSFLILPIILPILSFKVYVSGLPSSIFHPNLLFSPIFYSSSSHPHSFYTCRYLHNLIYIPNNSTPHVLSDGNVEWCSLISMCSCSGFVLMLEGYWSF